MARVLIVAGDPSGDLYGSLLILALRRAKRNLRVDAVGGPLMRKALAADDAFHCDLASLGVTGVFAPLRRLPLFVRLHQKLRALLERADVDVVVCIDFYGFNRHVLSAAKRAGVPVFYFISPQVWASRAGRIRHIKKHVERMLVIFPFEEPLYKKAGVPVAWVGHPLLDVLPFPNHHKPSAALRLGLLPGSRATEVTRHLPALIKAAARILRDFPDAKVTVFGAPQLSDGFYKGFLDHATLPDGKRPAFVRETDYAERSLQDLILTSSGTATVENALLGIPMVVLYKVAWPAYMIGRALIRVKHIAMANILAGRELVPELIQSDATPENIAGAALDMLGDPRRLAKLRGELLALRKKLGGPGAVDRAAAHILDGIAVAAGERAA